MPCLTQTGMATVRTASALADEVGDHPAVLPHLDVLDIERGQFPSPQGAADQQRQDHVVPLALHGRAVGDGQQFPRLLLRQPVPKPGSLLPDVRDVGQVGGLLVRRASRSSGLRRPASGRPPAGR